MRNYGRALLLPLFSLLLCSVATAATITFDNLTGPNGAPFISYTEAGFTVVAVSGSPQQGTAFGNPQPSIIIAAPVGSPAPGTVEVTSGGDLFTWSSMDLASNNGVGSDFIATGFRGGSLEYLFNNPLSIPIPSGSAGTGFFFVTETNPSFNGVLIDTLLISVSPRQGVTSANLDNIVVTPAAVPEPPTAVLVSLGLIVGASLVRRRISRDAQALSEIAQVPMH